MESPLLLPISTAAGGSPSSISVDDDNTAVETTALLSPPPPSSPSNKSIALRLVAVLTIACASLFAQHEASKGFAITVANGAGRGTLAGRRFHLFFASNGRAERMLHRASRGVERALFPDASFPRKRVTRVTLRMDDGHNLTTVGGGAGGEYVISLGAGLMSDNNKPDDAAVAAAVRRAVARMWLWDGRGAVPSQVTEAMVEYLASAGADDEVITSPDQLEEVGSEGDGRQCMSARFLRHLEQRRSGFVARLNRAMRDRWSDAAVDAALGVPARPVCAAYLAATATRGSSVAV